MKQKYQSCLRVIYRRLHTRKEASSKKDIKEKKNVSFIALQKGKKVPKLSFHMNDVEIKKNLRYIICCFFSLVWSATSWRKEKFFPTTHAFTRFFFQILYLYNFGIKKENMMKEKRKNIRLTTPELNFRIQLILLIVQAQTSTHRLSVFQEITICTQRIENPVESNK